MAGLRPDDGDRLDLRQLIGRLGEHLVERHLPHRQALLERIARQRFQRQLVLVRAIGPVVLAHDLAGLVVGMDRPRQGGVQMPDLGELVHAQRLGLDERLVDVHRDPRIFLDQRAADADGVHDRKQPGLLEIGLLDRRIIRKQPADIRRAAQKAARRPRARAAPSISPFASMSEIERSAGTGLKVDLRRQRDLGALLAAGLFQSAAPPFDVARLDAVFLLQHAAHPDIGGHLVFRQADRLALEVRPAS